jgi:hypothetical protein
VIGQAKVEGDSRSVARRVFRSRPSRQAKGGVALDPDRLRMWILVRACRAVLLDVSKGALTGTPDAVGRVRACHNAALGELKGLAELDRAEQLRKDLLASVPVGSQRHGRRLARSRAAQPRAGIASSLGS